MENTTQSYALALLKLMGNQEGANEDNPPLGSWALHLETQSSVFNLATQRLLQTLIEHSPSPEAVAQQFMTELAQCENSAVIDLVHNLSGDRSVSPDDWAAAVNKELDENGGNTSFLTDLASYYMTHLVIAFRKPSGNTPQESDPPSPDPIRAMEIQSLLDSTSVVRNQAALKGLVLRRDGPNCPVTHMSFEGDGSVIPYCAHIIPFSFHDKSPVLTAIEMFTGREVSADIIRLFINNPANAINIQADAHDSMDKRLAWGIEARPVNNGWKYYFRTVKPAGVPMIVRHFIQDGDEINFGRGADGAVIALPDPRLCNLHLAVARVFAASGFAEVADKIYRDNDGEAPTDFGDDLSRRLAMAVLSVPG